jgi:hypothetical protein
MFQIDIGGLGCLVAENWEQPKGLEALFVSAHHVDGPLGAKDFYCTHRATLTFWTATERCDPNEPTDNEYFEKAESWCFDGVDFRKPNAKTPPKISLGQVQTPNFGTLGTLDLQGKRVVFDGLEVGRAGAVDLGYTLALHKLIDGCHVDDKWRKAIPDSGRMLGCRVSLPDGCSVKGTAPSGPFVLQPIGSEVEAEELAIPGTLRVNAEVSEEVESVSVLAIDYGRHTVERITLAPDAKVAIATLCPPEVRPPMSPGDAKKHNDFGAVYALAKADVDFKKRIVPARPGVVVGKPWCPPAVGLWA